MFPGPEITKLLPQLRDDEPPSLRHDIVDEISDHLQCGLRRELLAQADEDLAKKRVLDRFGDPNQVARKLWIQAMWSKMMTQRLVVGSAIFSMAISAVFAGMVGWMMYQQQQTNAAMIEQMSKLYSNRSDPQPQRDFHWNNLKVKVNIGSIDGPPAEGFELIVNKLPEIGEVVKDGDFTSRREAVHSSTDSSGMTDCGYFHPGRYTVEVTTPQDEYCVVEFRIDPGQDHIEHIVAPEKLPEMTRVSFQLDSIPEDLVEKNAALLIKFWPDGPRRFASRSWERKGYRFESEMPFLLLVPGHGIWITSNLKLGQNSSSEDHARAVSLAKWQPIRESSMPATKFTVWYEFFLLTQSVSPDSPEWKDSVSSGPNNRQHSRSDRGEDVVAKPDQLNEWTLKIPDSATKEFRQTIQQHDQQMNQHRSRRQTSPSSQPKSD